MKITLIKELKIPNIKLNQFTKSDFPELANQLQAKYGKRSSKDSIYFIKSTQEEVLSKSQELRESFYKEHKSTKDKWIIWWFLERIQNSKTIEKLVKDIFLKANYQDYSKPFYDKNYKTDLVMKKENKMLLIQIKAFYNEKHLTEYYWTGKLIEKMKCVAGIENLNNKESLIPYYIKVMFDKQNNILKFIQIQN